MSRQLIAALPPEIGRLTSFPVEDGAVEAIAERLNGWLALPEEERGGDARGACRDRAAALELGGSGPRGARRLRGAELESFPPSLQ